jgi:hypothetical protein
MDENPANNASYKGFKRTQRAVRPLALGILFGLAALIIVGSLTGNWLAGMGFLAVFVVVGLLVSASRAMSVLQESDKER